jgi:polyvinyl alcohol dehydrogenase (cytochrome)
LDSVDIDTWDARANWTHHGFDHDNSRHNRFEHDISTENVANLQVAWKLDELIGVTSTPAAVDGVVYFGEWNGDLWAVQAEDGEPLWRHTLDSSPVHATPLVTDTHVYIGDSNGALHARHRDTGHEAWKVQLDDHPDTSIYSSAVAVDDMIVIGVASTELASVKDDYTFRGSVVALDAENGAERWRIHTTNDDETAGAGVSVWSTAAVDPDRELLFIGTGNAYEEPAGPLSDSLLAIDYRRGEVRWSRQFTEDDVYTIFAPEPKGPDADIGAAPNLFRVGDRDAVGVGDKAGTYAALDRDDGSVLWAVELTEGSQLGGVMTTAAVGDEVIFVNSNRFQEAYPFSFHEQGNTSTTFALDARTGEVLWETDLPRPALGGLTLAGGVVFHGTVGGIVHALDAETGIELWSDAPGDVGGGLSVSNGRLFVGYGWWFFTAPNRATGGFVAYTLPG